MKKSYFILALIAVISFSSCETDIEVNAPYEDITIVYGVIDPSVDTQYVKVNKTFLGDNNAYDLAADANNFNYADGDLDVIVEEVSAAGNVVNTYSLVRTVNEVTKDTGTFDDSENVLFRFVEPNINNGSIYKLKIINNTLDKEITSETTILKNSVVSDPANPALKLHFWSGAVSTGNFLDEAIKITTAKNVGRADAVLIFNYRDYYTNGDPYTEKSVRMSLGEEKTTTPLGNETLEWEMSGASFFSNITAAVPATSSIPFLNYREIRNISLEFNIAGTELSTYMEVSAPSTSVNQEKPGYTNIENGLGIFSSRTKMMWYSTLDTDLTNNINIGPATIRYLGNLGLGFCYGTAGVGFPVVPCQ